MAVVGVEVVVGGRGSSEGGGGGGGYGSDREGCRGGSDNKNPVSCPC